MVCCMGMHGSKHVYDIDQQGPTISGSSFPAASVFSIASYRLD